MAELHKPAWLAQLQNSARHRSARAPSSAACGNQETVRKSGGIEPTMLMKSTRSRAALAMPARRADAVTDQPYSSSAVIIAGVKRRLPALAA